MCEAGFTLGAARCVSTEVTLRALGSVCGRAQNVANVGWHVGEVQRERERECMSKRERERGRERVHE